MDKQILDRIKKSEQRVVDLYAKVRDLKDGDLELKDLREQYTILELPAGENEWAESRGKALKDLYQKLKDRDWYGSEYRHTILVPPGNYYFEDGEPLVLDYEGIDVVSLTGEPDVFLEVQYDDDPFAFNQLVNRYYEGNNLANANLSFLNIGDNIYGQNFGLDSQGIFFNNVDQGEDTPSYPVRFPGVINVQNNSYLYYDIAFIHENPCSDLGFAIWENGIIPEWGWGSTNTLFKVQIDCGDSIDIYGRNGSQSSMFTGGLTVGTTYRLIIRIYPDNHVFVGLVQDNIGWIVYNSYTGDFPLLSSGPSIIVGLAADSDGSEEGGSTMMHITSLYFSEQTTQFSPCLSIETSNVTVRGIAGYRINSNNWDNWSELDTSDYNFPIFVSPRLDNVIIENCIGGPFSFGADPKFNGDGQYIDIYTFKNCRAPQGYSFGYGVEDYAVTAISCNSLDYNGNYSPNCFDVDDELYVTVIDCRFGYDSFRGYEINITVKDTEVEENCFYAYSYFDGDFENVITRDFCFYNDVADIYGTYKNCKVGNYCFANDGTIYGNFFNCLFDDASIFNGTSATCFYCINDGGSMIVVDYAAYCVNITD